MGGYRYAKASGVERPCAFCGESFKLIRSNQIYCGPSCRNKRERAKYFGANNVKLGISTGAVGAIHELLVAVDLMKSGLTVYKAVSPDAPCDLAVLKGKELMIVEVTTGHRSTTNHLVYPRHMKNSHLYDVIAVVELDGKINYFPERPFAA